MWYRIVSATLARVTGASQIVGIDPFKRFVEISNKITDPL